MVKRLTGQVAVVTGGGRGIGRYVSLELAKAGARVVVDDLGGAVDGTGVDRQVAEWVVDEIIETGGEAIPCFESVSTKEGGKAIIAKAIENFGRIDIVCHVAGILRDRMVFNMTEEEWDAVIAVHLKGAFNVTRHAIPHMINQHHGRIIIFSSGSGLGNSGQANYSSAKEAQVGFVRSLARELGPYGITANAVYPGGSTRMTGTIPDSTRELRTQRGITGGGAMAGRVESVRTEEILDPENNAAKTVFLCTDEAANVNGQVIGTSGWVMSLYGSRHVNRAISKRSRWSLDELDQLMPPAITGALINPAPPSS